MRRRPCEARKIFSFYNAEIAILLVIAILSSGPVTPHTEAHDIPGNGDGGTAAIAEATTVSEVGSGRAAVAVGGSCQRRKSGGSGEGGSGDREGGSSGRCDDDAGSSGSAGGSGGSAGGSGSSAGGR